MIVVPRSTMLPGAVALVDDLAVVAGRPPNGNPLSTSASRPTAASAAVASAGRPADQERHPRPAAAARRRG